MFLYFLQPVKLTAMQFKKKWNIFSLELNNKEISKLVNIILLLNISWLILKPIYMAFIHSVDEGSD